MALTEETFQVEVKLSEIALVSLSVNCAPGPVWPGHGKARVPTGCPSVKPDAAWQGDSLPHRQKGFSL